MSAAVHNNLYVCGLAVMKSVLLHIPMEAERCEGDSLLFSVWDSLLMLTNESMCYLALFSSAGHSKWTNKLFMEMDSAKNKHSVNFLHGPVIIEELQRNRLPF